MLVAPTEGIAAADRAAIVKEVVREVARRLGRRATFSPLPDPEGIGNGVHVHISLLDADGRNALYAADRPGALSDLGGAFAAGLLRHLPALLAFTAPSAISYLRLTPHRWSAGTAALGYRNRECAVRICPVAELAGGDLSRQFNLEYRAMDGTASPHLALALLVRAGLAGIRGDLPTPPLLDRDPGELTAGRARGVRPARSRPISRRRWPPSRTTRSCAPGCRTSCGLLPLAEGDRAGRGARTARRPRRARATRR